MERSEVGWRRTTSCRRILVCLRLCIPLSPSASLPLRPFFHLLSPCQSSKPRAFLQPRMGRRTVATGAARRSEASRAQPVVAVARNHPPRQGWRSYANARKKPLKPRVIPTHARHMRWHNPRRACVTLCHLQNTNPFESPHRSPITCRCFPDGSGAIRSTNSSVTAMPSPMRCRSWRTIRSRSAVGISDRGTMRTKRSRFAL